MDVLDLIARAKALYLILKDPAVGWYAKFRAFTDFAAYVIRFLPATTTNPPYLSAAAKTTPAEALAGLEELGTAPYGHHDDEEVVEKVMVFLLTITPLDCCCE